MRTTIDSLRVGDVVEEFGVHYIVRTTPYRHHGTWYAVLENMVTAERKVFQMRDEFKRNPLLALRLTRVTSSQPTPKGGTA